MSKATTKERYKINNLVQNKGDSLDVWHTREDGFVFVYSIDLEVGYYVNPELIEITEISNGEFSQKLELTVDYDIENIDGELLPVLSEGEKNCIYYSIVDDIANSGIPFEENLEKFVFDLKHGEDYS